MAQVDGYFENKDEDGLWGNAFNDRYPKSIPNLLASNESDYIRRQSRKVYAVRYGGNKCQNCNYTHPLALSFHHNDPETKTATISNIIRGNTSDNSKEALEKEIDKCTILCINCHCETHATNTHNNSKQELLRLVGGIGFCLYCGYDPPTTKCLQFHHRDPKLKSFTISSLYSSSTQSPCFNENIKKVKTELAKCDVICANCHSLANSHTERFIRLYPQILAKSYKWETIKLKTHKYQDKENKRYERNQQPDDNGNIFGNVDNRSPKNIIHEDYYNLLDGLID